MIVFTTNTGNVITYFDTRWAHTNVLPGLLKACDKGLLHITLGELAA